MTLGPTGCSWNSKEVATPKLPPPPRTAQNSSGSSSWLARTTLPSAVTSSTARRLSSARPYLPISQPIPPPSVSPATPVLETTPPVTARRVQLGLAVDLAPGDAALDAHRSVLRVDVNALHRHQVDHQPTIDGGASRHVVAAAAHRHLQAQPACELDGIGHVGGAVAAGDQRGALVDQAVVDPSRVLIAAVRWLQQLPGEGGGGLGDGIGQGCDCAHGAFSCCGPAAPSSTLAASGANAKNSAQDELLSSRLGAMSKLPPRHPAARLRRRRAAPELQEGRRRARRDADGDQPPDQAAGALLWARALPPPSATVVADRGRGPPIPRIRDGLDVFATAIAAVKREGDTQPLRVTTTNAFASRWLVPRLPRWRKARPSAPLEVIGTDCVLDLQAGDADVAIRYMRTTPADGIAKEILSDAYWPVCNPELLSSGLKRAADLRQQVLVHSGYWAPSDLLAPTWQRWLDAARKRWRDVPEFKDMDHLSFREELHAIEAVIAGQGIGLFSDVLVASELAAGTLVKAFNLSLPGYRFYVVRARRHPREEDHPGLLGLAAVRRLRERHTDALQKPKSLEGSNRTSKT